MGDWTILLSPNFCDAPEVVELSPYQFARLIEDICAGRSTDPKYDYLWDVRSNQHRFDVQRKQARRDHREAVIERDGALCRACGATDDLTLDHVTPVTKGGTNDLDNLAVLCRPCNSSKGSKTWDEWMGRRV